MRRTKNPASDLLLLMQIVHGEGYTMTSREEDDDNELRPTQAWWKVWSLVSPRCGTGSVRPRRRLSTQRGRSRRSVRFTVLRE